MIKPSKKSTKAEIDQRLTEIQELLLDGHTRHKILQYGSKWKVSNRTVDEYIAQATALLKEINQASVQDNLAIITANQWKLYRSSVKDGNLATARQILMDLAKLRGLEHQTINHIIQDTRELADLSDADLEKMLEDANEPASH